MYKYFTDLSTLPNAVVDGTMWAVLLTLGFLIILVLAAVYVYFSLAWYTIAKKMKHKKPWLAWIPFANFSMWFQMGGFHWAWIFLVIIPILGWIAVAVLFIFSNWRVFEKLKYPGWLSLSPLLSIISGGAGVIAYGIVIGVIAWKKRKN